MNRPVRGFLRWFDPVNKTARTTLHSFRLIGGILVILEAILERCAGLDVHPGLCAHRPLDRAPRSEIRTFGTMTHELMELGEWLVSEGCTHVAMESNGIYWKSVWNVLEAFNLDLLLANAHHVKNLPGRKTDMKDAEWIAKLLRCGLIEGSFVPYYPF